MINLFSVPTKESLFTLWMIFMGLMVALLWLQWRSRYSVGLPLVYAFHFAIITPSPASFTACRITPRRMPS